MSGQTSPAVMIISAMITPALLILGSGSLAATAIQRLSRAIDRARILLQTSAKDAATLGWSEPELSRWLGSYEKRLLMAERAVLAFYAAIGTFVLGCLSIAADHYSGETLTWLPVSLIIIGMLFMLYGAVLMTLESRAASVQLREELQRRHPGR